MSDEKSLSIRIDDETRLKMHSVAKYWGRSANAHILFLIRRDIEDFEKMHGKIEEVKA